MFSSSSDPYSSMLPEMRPVSSAGIAGAAPSFVFLGVGFRVQGLGFRVWCLGLRVRVSSAGLMALADQDYRVQSSPRAWVPLNPKP